MVHYFEDYPIMFSPPRRPLCLTIDTFISNSSLFLDTYHICLPIISNLKTICLAHSAKKIRIRVRLGQMRIYINECNVKMIVVMWFVPKLMQTVRVWERDEWIAKFMHINSIRVQQKLFHLLCCTAISCPLLSLHPPVASNTMVFSFHFVANSLLAYR